MRGDFFTRNCRYCKSYEMFELPMEGLWEAAFLPPVFMRPYRCNRCLRKQFGFRFIKPMKQPADRNETGTPADVD